MQKEVVRYNGYLIDLETGEQVGTYEEPMVVSEGKKISEIIDEIYGSKKKLR